MNPGVAELNGATTMTALFDHQGPVGQAASAGNVEIRGGIHDLRTGQLRPVPPTHPESSDQHQTPTPTEAS